MSERFLRAQPADEIVKDTFRLASAVLACRNAAEAPHSADAPHGAPQEFAGELISQIRSRCEQLEREALVQRPRVACRAGCGWCCSGTKVDVLAPEALAIAQYLRQSSLETLRLRIRETARLVRQLSASERHRQAIACPFLDDHGACFIHPLRPISCRGHSSLNAEDCEFALAHFEEDRPIRKHVPLLLSQSAVSTGLRLALARGGLDASVLELSNAIDIALSHRDAEQRWARGERIFAPAASPTPSSGDCPQPSTDLLRPRVTQQPTRNQRKAQRRAKQGR